MHRRKKRKNQKLSTSDVAEDIEGTLLECCKYINQQHSACWRESFFQKSLAFELQQRGYNVSLEVAYPVYYTSTAGTTTSVGNVFVDILTDTFAIETKLVGALNEKHRQQARLYSRILNKTVFLLNIKDDPQLETFHRQ